MSIQSIINTAQAIEVSRPAVVATSMSRSGRMFTGTRNWAKPWRFTVTPKPYWTAASSRSIVEAIMTADKNTEQTIALGQTAGATWMVDYQGQLDVNSGHLVGVTVDSATGTTISVSYTGQTSGRVIVAAGDIIQPVGHRYPYVVKETVSTTGASGTASILINRGYLPQTGYTVAGQNINVGTACTWRVKVSKLPAYRYVPGKLIEFTSEFELIESII